MAICGGGLEGEGGKTRLPPFAPHKEGMPPSHIARLISPTIMHRMGQRLHPMTYGAKG
jgi:hypothetical protein